MFPKRKVMNPRSRSRNLTGLLLTLVASLFWLLAIASVAAQDQSQAPQNPPQDSGNGKPKQDAPSSAGGPTGDVGPGAVLGRAGPNRCEPTGGARWARRSGWPAETTPDAAG